MTKIGANLIEEIFAAWREGRADDVLARFAPNAVWHFSAGTRPPAIGREAIQAFLAAYGALWRESRVRVLRRAWAESTVFFEAVEDVTDHQGREIIVPYCGVVTCHHGLISDWRDYFDRGLLEGQMAGTSGFPDYAQPLIGNP